MISVALGALSLDHPLSARALMYLRALWGFVGDMAAFDSGFERGAGHAVLNRGWCVRSRLQCSPVLALALLGARAVEGETPERAVGRRMLAAVVLGILTGCTLRAHTGGAYVWGWPFLNIRYVALLLPAATALAALGVSQLPWRPRHAVATGALTAVAVAALSRRPETDAARQWATHLLPLLAAAAALVAVSRRARVGDGAATAAVCAALACSAAVTLGIDLDAARRYRGAQTERTRELARCTRGAQRFVLIGARAADEALALHDARDITIVNPAMSPRVGASLRPLIDRLARADRPAFAILDAPSPRPPWARAGIALTPIAGCARVFRAASAP